MNFCVECRQAIGNQPPCGLGATPCVGGKFHTKVELSLQVGHVKDLGYHPDDPTVRVYQTKAAQVGRHVSHCICSC